jgi:hypothetical protein
MLDIRLDEDVVVIEEGVRFEEVVDEEVKRLPICWAGSC